MLLVYLEATAHVGLFGQREYDKFSGFGHWSGSFWLQGPVGRDGGRATLSAN